MMELISDSFDIRCCECGEQITIFKDDLDPDVSFFDHGENGMGIETIYEIRHELSCPQCGNNIEITITGNEYPEGAYDYDSAELSGAEFIETPSMGMVYYQDEFDVDEYAVEATGIRGLIAQLSENRDMIYDVTSREFEEIVEQVLQDDGFDTHLTQPTRDGGRDIIATKTGINGKPVVFYVECKRYSRTNKVSVDPDVSFFDHGENGMGIETIYEIRHELSCPQCGNNIEITITGNEYPEGAYDYDSAELSGAEFIETPSMGMVYYQDEFDVDEYAVEATGIRGLIAQLSENRDMIYDVTSREFEEIVEQVLQDDGFDTHLTQPTRDGGRDIIATKTGINGKPVVFYVECKRYSRTNKVSVDLVRALYGVQTADKVNKACLVTSSCFTRDAVAFAENQNVMIDLIDGDALHDMIVRSAEKYEQENYRRW